MANIGQGSTEEWTSSASQEATRTADRQQDAAARAHSTVDRVASAMHSATDRVSAKTDEWMHTQDEMLASTRNYVRDQPMMALGIAFAVGFVLSRIMR